MSEEVINYDSNRKSTFWEDKKRGFWNRYYVYKRKTLWFIHRNRHQIDIDYARIDKDSIPVLINNFNRLEFLKSQIDWLNSLGNKVSIIIVDNNSDYPPLLDFYKNIQGKNVQVVYLKFNTWRLGLVYLAKKLKGFEKIIITDPDLMPYPDTPKDLISHLAELLDKYPGFNHVGTSLGINDLPENGELNEKIIQFESRYWSPIAEELNDEVFVAKIDTTFAIYRNTSDVISTSPALRTKPPYILKHLDWYILPEDYTEEYRYYLSNSKSFATWAKELKKNIL